MSKYSAFIDETGDPIFSDGASEYFFVGAILIPSETEKTLSDSINKIKDKFGIQELKSARTSDGRRYRILEEVLTLQFKLLTIEVHKDELEGDWFRYKNSFYKYIQRTLIRQIYQLYGEVNIEVDRYGTEKYQESMRLYIQNDMQRSLFENGSFSIGSAKVNNLIQLADFITGTLRKIQSNDIQIGEDLRRTLNTKWSVQKKIPERGSRYVRPLNEDQRPDSITSCVEEAKRYLDKSKSKHDHAKTLVLEYLYQNAIDDPEGYVYTRELNDWLSLYSISLPEENFRTEVIARLRDEGQIIISSSKGYKIPTSTNEIIRYIEYSSNKSIPQLKRLKRVIEFYASRHDPSPVNDVVSDELQAILDAARI